MTFDAISKNKRKDKQDEKVVLLGKHAQSRGKVYVKLDGDVFTLHEITRLTFFPTVDMAEYEIKRGFSCSVTPWITGCAVMPNGIIAICDYYNDRLKLFDNFWVCKGSFAIPDIWSISVADSNTVTVTVPGQKKIQYVQILPHLQLGHTIQLDSECWGVCLSGDDIYMYVTCETSDGQGEIRVLGHDGTEKRRVPADWNSWPKHVTLSPSGEKIFFTDYNTDIVTCMTVDSRTVYTYKNDNLKGTTGIFCDSEDNLLVCCCASNTVQAISVDCKRGGTLLTSSDGLDRPWCIAYRSSDDELIIGCDAPACFLVYKMR